MTRDALAWLKRPIAHRGLHDEGQGIVENSASAIAAAIDGGYAIEVDLRCAADGLPVVFHDEQLDRLTGEKGLVAARDAAALCTIPLRHGTDRILSLEGLLDLVDGRVPVVLEVKSTWGGDPRYEASIAEILKSYRGHVAVMSFDPDCVAAFKRLAPALPRGLVSERFADTRHWSNLSALRRFAMRHLLTAAMARPNFIAYDIKALPALAPAMARSLFGLPLITWTVRSEADKAKAKQYADAMIFEGVLP
jgi:glycerophosphoryl diester phosphodiesterase